MRERERGGRGDDRERQKRVTAQYHKIKEEDYPQRSGYITRVNEVWFASDLVA